MLLDSGGHIKLDAADSDIFFQSGGLTSIQMNTSEGTITAKGNVSSSITSTASFGSLLLANLPTSEADALSKGLFTLSGSQIFSSSAFPGGSNTIFNSGDFSSSLFVFQKA